VTAPVERVELTFLDPVMADVVIDVVDGSGESVAGSGEALVSDDGTRASVSLRDLTTPGGYVVEYTFSAQDGDTQRETFRFEVVAADADDGSSSVIAAAAAGVAVTAVAGGLVVSLRRRRRAPEGVR
jgi:hypothetical protein